MTSLRISSCREGDTSVPRSGSSTGCARHGGQECPPHVPLTTNQRIARVWAWLAVLGLLLGLTNRSRGAESEVTVAIEPRYRGEALKFDQLSVTNAAGQALAVTRLDLLLSGIAVRRTNGTWLEKHYWFAFINGRAGRTNFVLRGLPAGDYDRLRFNIGVPAEQNLGNPAQWDAAHPLNPTVNGLHWNWQGGYVFLALEGKWASPSSAAGQPAGNPVAGVNRLDAWLADTGLSHPSPVIPAGSKAKGQELGGFSWHLATARQLMMVEVPVTLAMGNSFGPARTAALRLGFDLARVLDEVVLDDETSSTHSREGDELADRLRQGVERAFVVGSRALPAAATRASTKLRPGASMPGAAGEKASAVGATNFVGTPYRFTMSSFFPKPALPLDNPLTVEGVELGRRLFHDPLLSRGEKQSCASCHQADTGTVDGGKAFSLGVDGLPGKRNAMPLYNLAWKSEFFWDGRAKSLRQQALMPIQDELEMHETLENVVRKLVAAGVPPGGPGQPKAITVLSDSSRPSGKVPPSTAGRMPAATGYATLFTRAFGSPEITAERVSLALEQFLLTLTSHDAKFDRVLRGEAKFTAEEQRGFELFHTEHDPRRGQFGADCFHCHGGPLFQNVAFANNGLDYNPADLGRYNVTGQEGDKGKFAVPSLRNVELTAPYMHDGRFATLEAAVLHYVRGVRRSPTLDPNLAKHPPGGVRIPPEDLHALVAFLKTLTDEALRPGRQRAALTPSP